MNKFKDMSLLCKVVEKGNFAQAAKSLNVTPAIVGRRITALENSLGFLLFNRSTRQMHLTAAGQDYYRGAKKILGEVIELEDGLKTDNQVNPNGIIHISAPDGLGSDFLVKAIKDFKQDYPNIQFALHLDNRPMDLIENNIDLTFRLSFDLQDSSYIVTKLTETTFGLFGSAQYLKTHGVPKSIEDLKDHDCIQMGASRYGDYWTLMQNGEVIAYRQDWSLIVSNSQSVIQALSSDMGIAIMPMLFVDRYVIPNNLVQIKGISDFPNIGVYALFPTKNHLPYRLRLFLDFIKEWFKSN
jgi:DNA-binding transcriptional LysR family regulator